VQDEFSEESAKRDLVFTVSENARNLGRGASVEWLRTDPNWTLLVLFLFDATSAGPLSNRLKLLTAIAEDLDHRRHQTPVLQLPTIAETDM
jgi:hypothetical protein